MKTEKNIKLKIINTYSKGFDSVKTEETSPLVMNLPEDKYTELINGNLKFEVYETNEELDQYLFNIYVGEVYTFGEMRKMYPKFTFSEGMSWLELSVINDETPCIFYKDVYKKYVLLAKLNPEDLVVKDNLELQNLIESLAMELKNPAQRMSRKLNIK
jgi:hypothetical protein